jgi:hypothetical protein
MHHIWSAEAGWKSLETLHTICRSERKLRYRCRGSLFYEVICTFVLELLDEPVAWRGGTTYLYFYRNSIEVREEIPFNDDMEKAWEGWHISII